MTIGNFQKFTELLWVFLGIIFVCSLLATFRVVQEMVEPNYSGLGIWYPLIQLPVVIIVSCIVALIVQATAILAHWSSLKLKRHSLGLGAICALSTVSTLPVMCLVFVVALWVRYELSFIILQNK